MVHKDQQIELVAKSVQHETPNHRSVFFHRPPGFVFEAGDWVDIEFEGRKLGGGKTYSISSSPTESDIRITLRDGLSELKKVLESLKDGEKFVITQYGNDYGFQLRSNRSSVLIAGGVGIAPFRSMLKEMYDNHDPNEVTLIYLNQNDNFLFKEELNEWEEKLPNVTIHYIETKLLNRKKREKLILSLIKDQRQHFYIAGPPGMVESMEHLLLDSGVLLKNIRIDSFGGY